MLAGNPWALYYRSMEELHQPVLLAEVLACLRPEPQESYLDLTAGYGGHAENILDVTRNWKGSVLVDRDGFAASYLAEKFRGKGIEIVNTDFCSAASQLLEQENTFDMVLLDLGVSSLQLDRAGRGFSFLHDGPLDMRMDQRQKLTAETILNKWSKRELERILREYGEETPGLARKHAQMIVAGRPWKTTKQLATAIGEKRYGRAHPATRVFQAVRIAVNDELALLEKTLPMLPKLLNPGGRIAIITFHSLEDRMVKRFFKEESSFGEESELKILTKKPLVAEKMELVINPRARSAKLRAGVKNCGLI